MRLSIWSKEAVFRVLSFFYSMSLMILLTLLFFVGSSITSRAQEVPALSAPVLQGWGTFSRAQGNNVSPGITLPGSDISLSSPAVGDLDGNPSNGNEVVVVSSDGTIAAFSSKGALLWSVHTPNVSCGSPANRVYSSPAIGALYGGTTQYVVVGYGGFGTECDGGVAAFKGTDGSLAWDFSLRRWAKRQKFSERFAAVFSSPALADVDGNGTLEVGFGGLDRRVYLLEHTGKVRWYYQAADSVFSSPAFANINKDSNLEMIIGTDISQNKKINPPTKNGGIVYALRTQKPRKRSSRQYLFRSEDLIIWKRFLPQVIQSSPLVADLVPESPGLEIAIGSGCYFPERSTDKTGRWVKVLRARSGRALRTLDTPTCSSASPAAGDLNGDGVPDLVTAVRGSADVGGDGFSRLIAWTPSTRVKLWETVPFANGRNDPLMGYFNSPVIADIDGNGSLEVIFPHYTGIGIVDGATGRSLLCEETCSPRIRAQLNTGERMRATPTLADLNRDGILEIIAGGGYRGSTQGGLYAWTSLRRVVTSPVRKDAPPYAAPWPSFRGGSAHEGTSR